MEEYQGQTEDDKSQGTFSVHDGMDDEKDLGHGIDASDASARKGAILDLEAATSKKTTTSGEYNKSPIPDGGSQAWLQAVSGFFLGIVTAYGVFQSYYVNDFLKGESNSAVAWIGTIQGFLLAFMSIFAGPVLDRGHPHWLIMIGGFMVVFGLMMTSLDHAYWQLFLAQGVCVGLGSGQLFIVAVAIIPGWFDRYRAFATGIAAAGSATGGIIYPIMFRRLQPVLGFGWAVRIMGFIVLAGVVLSLLLCKQRTLPPPRPKIVDFSGFEEVLFTLFCVLSFVGSMGLYVPYFFITDYAAQRSHLGEELAFFMLPIMASGGLIGRTLPAMIADKFGCLQTLTFTTSISALLIFCWIPIRESKGGLIAWSILYGVFSGPFVSLQTPTIAAITADMRFVGGRMGMATLCLALGVLVGNPIAGKIMTGQDWVGLQWFVGATLAASTILIAATMVMKGRQDRAGQTLMWSGR
ncbi:MFS general substrate transporter [Lecanosticta acicola]|uniref:MFS general substrate transporter n=1 Tax=Lecanosticta acicola TaxID=111012 RepID=A0AAI9EA08_9PEZI|nr:MFS general substrate transporter [Lecanosticta acicola]